MGGSTAQWRDYQAVQLFIPFQSSSGILKMETFQLTSRLELIKSPPFLYKR